MNPFTKLCNGEISIIANTIMYIMDIILVYIITQLASFVMYLHFMHSVNKQFLLKTIKLAGCLPNLATSSACKVHSNLGNCIWWSRWMKSLVTRYMYMYYYKHKKYQLILIHYKSPLLNSSIKQYNAVIQYHVFLFHSCSFFLWWKITNLSTKSL